MGSYTVCPVMSRIVLHFMLAWFPYGFIHCVSPDESHCTTFDVGLIPIWVHTLCVPWWVALYYNWCWPDSHMGSYTVWSVMSRIVLHFRLAWFPYGFIHCVFCDESHCTTFDVGLIPIWVHTLCVPWWVALYYIWCWLDSHMGSYTVCSVMSCSVLHFMSAWFADEFPRESAWSACSDFTWSWVPICILCA